MLLLMLLMLMLSMLMLMLFMLILMLMLLMLLLILLILMLKMLMWMCVFVDDHYVCSSVAGSLSSAHKAHYPPNFGVPGSLLRRFTL